MSAYRAHGEPTPIKQNAVFSLDIMQGTPIGLGGPTKYWWAIEGVGSGNAVDTFEQAKQDGLTEYKKACDRYNIAA